MTGHLANIGTEGQNLVRKPGRKRILGSPRLRWDQKILIHPMEIRSVDCIRLPMDKGQWRPLEGIIMNTGNQ
jgi:hypothetical protein